MTDTLTIEKEVENKEQNKKETRVSFKDVNEAIKIADDRYMSMMLNKEYQNVLDEVSKFSNLSLRNVMLVKLQMPEATMVRSLDSWHFLNRQVNEGEKGIKILIPVFEETLVSKENGDVRTQKTDKIAGYRYGYVFDISQTKGEPILDREVNKKNAQGIYDHLKTRISGELLHNVEIREEVGKTEFGELSLVNNQITINDNLTPTNKVKALVAETSQALPQFVHSRRAVKPGTFYNLEQLEAQATSYIVAQKIGLPYVTIPNPVEKMHSLKEIEDYKGSLFNIRNNVNKIMVCYNEAYRDYEREKEAMERIKAKEEKKEEAKKEVVSKKQASANEQVPWDRHFKRVTRDVVKENDYECEGA